MKKIKKIETLVVAIIAIIFLNSCAFTVEAVKEPNTKIEKGMLNKYSLEAHSMVGAYGNFSKGFTIWSDNADQRKEEETRGGVVRQVRIVLGTKYTVPAQVPVLMYSKNKKKVKHYTENGKVVYKSFLYEISHFNKTGDEAVIEVLLDDGSSIDLLFTASQYKSDRFYIKTLKKGDVSNIDIYLNKGFKVDKYHNIYSLQSGKKYYLTIDDSGNTWHISEDTKSVYLNMFRLERGLKDGVKKGKARSKTFGS